MFSSLHFFVYRNSGISINKKEKKEILLKLYLIFEK
jgi:hypothetical protein